MLRSWPEQKVLVKYVRKAHQQFAKTNISEYIGFPTDDGYHALISFDGQAMVIKFDPVRRTSEEITNRTQLPRELQQVLAGNYEQRAVSRGNGTRYTTGNWYQLQDNVATVRGGLYRLASGETNYFVSVRSRSGKELCRYDQHRWNLTAVTVSRNGKVGASVDKFGDIHVWRTHDAKQLRVFRSSKFKRLYNVAWDETGTKLGFSTQHYPAGQYDVNHFGPINYQFDLARRRVEAAPPHRLAEARRPIQLSRIRLDGKNENRSFGLQGRHHGRIYQYDDRQEFDENQFGDPMCWTFLRRQSPSVNFGVIAGSDTGRLRLLDFTSDGGVEIRRDFLGHHNHVTGVSVSPDGRLLASSSIDGTICIWNLGDTTPIGDVDFDFRGNQVLLVDPESEAAKAGVRPGDRVLKFDGVSFYESRLGLGCAKARF